MALIVYSLLPAVKRMQTEANFIDLSTLTFHLASSVPPQKKRSLYVGADA